MTIEQIEAQKMEEFDNLLRTFQALLNGNSDLYVYQYAKAIELKILDFNNSIMSNLNSFMNSLSNYSKSSQTYQRIKENYQNLLILLAHSVDEIKCEFYNKKLIDVMLDYKLVPYEQVDLTRLFFNNTTKQEQKEFLEEQSIKIIDGGTNFKIINSLDRISIDSEILRNNLIYQLMIERLISDHVKHFDKYKEQDKNERNFDKFCVRLVYRHQNRGYYIPDGEYRDAIINAYAYNGWFKELKHMVTKNSLGITKENYMEIIEQVRSAFADMAIVCDLSEGMYISELEKYNEIITMICEVADQEYKLTRKGEE